MRGRDERKIEGGKRVAEHTLHRQRPPGGGPGWPRTGLFYSSVGPGRERQRERPNRTQPLTPCPALLSVENFLGSPHTARAEKIKEREKKSRGRQPAEKEMGGAVCGARMQDHDERAVTCALAPPKKLEKAPGGSDHRSAVSVGCSVAPEIRGAGRSALLFYLGGCSAQPTLTCYPNGAGRAAITRAAQELLTNTAAPSHSPTRTRTPGRLALSPRRGQRNNSVAHLQPIVFCYFPMWERGGGSKVGESCNLLCGVFCAGPARGAFFIGGRSRCCACDE